MTLRVAPFFTIHVFVWFLHATFLAVDFPTRQFWSFTSSYSRVRVKKDYMHSDTPPKSEKKCHNSKA